MTREDLERWQRYLNPGCQDDAPPTDHTIEELARELVEEAINDDRDARLEEAEDEIMDLRAEMAGLRESLEDD